MFSLLAWTSCRTSNRIASDLNGLIIVLCLCEDPLVAPHKLPVIWNVGNLFVVSLSKLSNKQSGYYPENVKDFPLCFQASDRQYLMTMASAYSVDRMKQLKEQQYRDLLVKQYLLGNY